MKEFGCTILGMVLFTSLVVAQSEEPAEQENQEVATPPQIGEPVKPPRIPGRAQSQEEWDAWQNVVQAVDSAQKSELAKSFLETYPSSGLSSNAHFLIAQRYYEVNDIDNFILHGEKALEELPDLVTFLGQLAFFYAERGEAEKAIDRAERALESLERLERPANVAINDFVVQTRQLKAEAKYALGRAYLSQVTTDPEKRTSDPNLLKSVVNLKEALRFDPRHDYASFRLGFAYRNMNNAVGAMESYARAVIVGGVAAEQARMELEEILDIVKKAAPDSTWGKKTVQDIVDEGTQDLEKDIAQQRQEISQIVAELEQQEAEQQQETERSPGVQELPPDVVTPPAPPAE
jgi:tetratricopeptide (TPR) repeat protein